MLCVRCSHPLAPGADRCGRCFALNPRHQAVRPLKTPPPEPGPEITDEFLKPPIGPSIASDPPPLLAASFDSDPPLDFHLEAPRTPPPRDPALAAPQEQDLGDIDIAQLDLSSEAPTRVGEPNALQVAEAQTDLAELKPVDLGGAGRGDAPVELDESWRVESDPPPARGVLARELDIEAPAQRPRSPWAPPGARLFAWALDAMVLAACSSLLIVAAAEIVGTERLAPAGSGSFDYWLDLVASRRRLPLWGALFALLAVAYSWLFGALGGRTPGMAALGLRLVELESRRPPQPRVALGRAALSLVSAAPALFGFFLALFDPRGQSLHDRAFGTAVIVDDGAPLR